MIGSDRIRICPKCKVKALQIEDLSDDQIVDLVVAAEPRVNPAKSALFRKADGTYAVANLECPPFSPRVPVTFLAVCFFATSLFAAFCVVMNAHSPLEMLKRVFVAALMIGIPLCAIAAKQMKRAPRASIVLHVGGMKFRDYLPASARKRFDTLPRGQQLRTITRVVRVLFVSASCLALLALYPFLFRPARLLLAPAAIFCAYIVAGRIARRLL